MVGSDVVGAGVAETDVAGLLRGDDVDVLDVTADAGVVAGALAWWSALLHAAPANEAMIANDSIRRRCRRVVGLMIRLLPRYRAAARLSRTLTDPACNSSTAPPLLTLCNAPRRKMGVQFAEAAGATNALPGARPRRGRR